MADNIAVTAGTGTSVATDDVAGVHYQKVKLALGAADAAVLASGGAGAVDTGTLRFTLGSDDPAVTSLDALEGLLGALDAVKSIDPDASAAIGAVLKGVLDRLIALLGIHTDWDNDTDPAVVVAPSDVITVSFTVPTDAQDDNDVIAATQEIANFFRVNGGKTTLQSIVAIDTDDQGVDFDIVFMNANTTLGTEDAAPDIDDTEVLTVTGVVEGIGITTVADPRYSPFIDLGAARVATRTGVGLVLEAGAATTSAWAGLITRGTPTYASGIITVKFGILQD